MRASQHIRVLTNEEVDKTQWDEKLYQSCNKLIYCESVFLDHMCPGWAGITQDDWSALMPLPVKKKWGIRYAFQPPFVQQLGVFYDQPGSADIYSMLATATEAAPLIDLNFNYHNQLSSGKLCCNYILPLNESFADLKRKFRKDLAVRAKANHLHYCSGTIDETFDAYIQDTFPKTKRLAASSIQQFKQLCNHYNDATRVICRKVISPQNEPLSHALFLKDEKRIYYVMSATTSKGRAVDANALLLYEVIKEFSESQMIFDFEGSEIPGVKFFFEKFGPENQPYTRIQVDKLNLFQKGIKSIRELIRK